MAFNLLENAGARPPKKIEKREKLKKLESQIPRFQKKTKNGVKIHWILNGVFKKPKRLRKNPLDFKWRSIFWKTPVVSSPLKKSTGF